MEATRENEGGNDLVFIDKEIGPLAVEVRGRAANPFTPVGLDVAIAVLLEANHALGVREISRRTGASVDASHVVTETTGCPNVVAANSRNHYNDRLGVTVGVGPSPCAGLGEPSGASLPAFHALDPAARPSWRMSQVVRRYLCAITALHSCVGARQAHTASGREGTPFRGRFVSASCASRVEALRASRRRSERARRADEDVHPGRAELSAAVCQYGPCGMVSTATLNEHGQTFNVSTAGTNAMASLCVASRSCQGRKSSM